MNAGLNQSLLDYAALYRTVYSEEASVAELIPFMLEAFLESDRSFAKACRAGAAKTDGDKSATATRVSKAGKPAISSSNVQPTAQQKEI